MEALAAEDEGALIERLSDLLDDAIRLRFRADVPVAISLKVEGSIPLRSRRSRTQRGRLIAFTFGDPSDPRGEGPAVGAFADRSGIEVRYVSPGTSDIVAAFLDTLKAQGAPFSSASIMAQYLLYKGVGSAGVRVLLGGQGGDEAFMGYRKFQLLQMRELLEHGSYRRASMLLPGLALMLASEVPQARTYARFRHRYQDGAQEGDLFHPFLEGQGSPHWLDDGEDLRGRQVRDVLATSLPTLLRYEDRNSMAHSVESRLPFLDYRLVEFAIALPSALKIRKGYGKWILRQALEGKVPRHIRLARRKRGFDVQQQS